MAVQPQTPYKEYTANGSTKSFALEFDCENQDHLIVLVDDMEPVVGTWSLSGGAVVFGTAPTTGKKITIQRNTPFRRDGDFQSYDNSFRPGPVNKGFDWVWLKLQELGVADWILSNRIDALKNYVDDRDDELRAYLMEEIRKQGVALDQLDDYYNYLMQRLAQIAVDKGWDASFVTYSGLNQKQINDGLESVGQLLEISPTIDKIRVFVKNYANPNPTLAKPYLGGGGGYFEFVLGSTDTPDNVYTFAGIGGIWKRVNWLMPTIYDAGITDESLNNTAKFKALLSAAATKFKCKKEIDLCGLTLKVTDFIMYSDMYITNGGLDFTGSNVITSDNAGYTGLVVGENSPNRNINPGDVAFYANMKFIRNFGFINVYFKSPAVNLSFRRNILSFIKFYKFTLKGCRFDLSYARGFKLLGGFSGTNYTGLGLWDQPIPFNGFSSKALIKNNTFTNTAVNIATDGTSDAGQCAAVSEAEISFNIYKNVNIGAYLDAYCKDSEAHNNIYEITDDIVTQLKSFESGSICGVYVGQCAYNISVYKNRIINAVSHNVIVEAGSHVSIYDNYIAQTAAHKSMNFVNANSVTIQPNIISDGITLTTMVKGCDNIHIYDNLFLNVRKGILVASVHLDSARGIQIHDNTIKLNGSLNSLTLSNVIDSDIHDNSANALITIGRAINCVLRDNVIKSAENFALYLTPDLKTGSRLIGNEFYCDSGPVIYNGIAGGEVLNLHGGVLQQTTGTVMMRKGTGVGDVRCYGFENNVAQKQFTHSAVLNLAVGATTLLTIPQAGAKQGWFAEASLRDMGSHYSDGINLSIEASTTNGSVELLVTNKGGAAINFTPTYYILLSSYADNTFLN